MNPRVATMIGFAKRSGNLANGFTAVTINIKKRKAKLVMLSEDLSADSRRKITNLCQSTNTPIYTHGTRDEIGRAIGREESTVIAILDKKFAKIVEEQLDDIN
jgi:ribosomal protein L7Ae-like RNA K-turn-binding protein